MTKKNKLKKKKGKPTPVNFQDTILNLQKFWGKYGCIILQPYDIEVGAGTFHPATTLRSLGPKPWRAAYVQPSRRPTDGRYGQNPNRLQHYYQFQVIIKPSPDNIKKSYQDILRCLIGDGTKNGVCGINIVEQFQPEDNSRVAIPRNINAAFLISLSGEDHYRYTVAMEYLEEMENDPLWTNLVTFYREGLSLLLKEFRDFCSNSNNGIERVEELRVKLAQQKEPPSFSQTSLEKGRRHPGPAPNPCSHHTSQIY